jgi:glycosyltransferase involved in cell wall biosynthesis/cytochrome c-type biogenesis protein CcmH/NrfG
MGLARHLAQEKRWKEACALFTRLHELYPSRADALLGLGRCLERIDREEEALAAYGKVLELDQHNANALLYRGRLLRQLGRSDEAIEAWQEVARKHPQSMDAWYELIFMLSTADRDAEAVAAFESAERALPPSAASWLRLGAAAHAGQFHDRAVEYFERAIAADRNNATTYAVVGQHYQRQGLVNRAFAHLLASRELDPTDVTVAKDLIATIRTLNVIGVDHLRLTEVPSSSADILVPERLFNLVRDAANSAVVPYDPVPRRVIAATASLAAGGAERQLVNLLRGLSDDKFGLELAVFCISLAKRSRRDFFLPALVESPVEVVTPPDDQLEVLLSQPEVAPFAALIRAFPSDMAGLIAFWLREFRSRRPQVVHAWQDSTALTAAVAALLAGVPKIILAARSVRPDNPRRRLKRFMREAYQAVLSHPSVTLTNNSRAGARDYADWLDLDANRIQVVYNGIDFDKMSRSVLPERVHERREQLGIPIDAPLIGSAFRMSEEKRPLLWVETAAKIAQAEPRAHFVVYGDGPLRSAMADAASAAGIGQRLHLPGPDDAIAYCYRAMDMVLLTSRHEGLPNVLLEAQSLGVPVVAPDVGGVRETILQGVTGWAVAAANASSLADSICQSLRDSAWMQEAREEAPRFVRQRFGINEMLRRTLEVYGLADEAGAAGTAGS